MRLLMPRGYDWPQAIPGVIWLKWLEREETMNLSELRKWAKHQVHTPEDEELMEKVGQWLTESMGLKEEPEMPTKLTKEQLEKDPGYRAMRKAAVEMLRFEDRHPTVWKELSPKAQEELRSLEAVAKYRGDRLEKERRDHELVMEKLKKLEVWRVQDSPVTADTMEPGVVIPVTDTVTVPRSLLRRLMNARLRDLPEVLKELTPYVTSAGEPSET